MISPIPQDPNRSERPKPPDISTIPFPPLEEADPSEPEYRVAMKGAKVATAKNKRAFIFDTPCTLVSFRPNGGSLKRTRIEHASVFSAAASVAMRVLGATDERGNPTPQAADMAKFLLEQGIGKPQSKTEITVKDESDDGLAAALERLDRGIQDLHVQDILGTRPRIVANTAGIIPPDPVFDGKPRMLPTTPPED